MNEPAVSVLQISNIEEHDLNRHGLPLLQLLLLQTRPRRLAELRVEKKRAGSGKWMYQ